MQLCVFFDFGEGVVDRVEGVDVLKSHPMMIDYQIKLQPGDVLKQPEYGRLRPGHFIIGADDKEAVIKEEKKILEAVRVVLR